MADWGAPANPLMKALSLSIRTLDGFDTTRENLDGALPRMFEAGEAMVRGQFSTIYGTLAFYSAMKPLEQE